MNAPVRSIKQDILATFTDVQVSVPDQITSDLPFPFIPVSVALPTADKALLAIRLSGYHGAKYEILTAKYMPTCRPRNPWQTLGNDGVTDSGDHILGWAYADKLLC